MEKVDANKISFLLYIFGLFELTIQLYNMNMYTISFHFVNNAWCLFHTNIFTQVDSNNLFLYVLVGINFIYKFIKYNLLLTIWCIEYFF